jgi:hypothetical protein
MFILWANFTVVQACRICIGYHVLRLCVPLLDKQKFWMKVLCENLRGGCHVPYCEFDSSEDHRLRRSCD